MPNVVMSFYLVDSSSDSESEKSDKQSWNDHPGKHLLAALQRALVNSARDTDAIMITIVSGGLRKVSRIASAKEPVSSANERMAAQQVRREELEAGSGDDMLLEEFWRPHLDHKRPTVIVYGEPLFTREGNVFVRNIRQNVERVVKRKKERSDKECWPFMAAGTALCALHLVRWFTQRNVEVGWLGCRAGDHLSRLLENPWKERANVIILGSVRSNGVLAYYQSQPLGKRTSWQHSEPQSHKTLPYQLKDDIVAKIAHDGEIDGEPKVDQLNDSSYQVWSVISRREGIIDGTVTMVAANYGQIIARLGEVLTDEELFARFLEKHQPLKANYLSNPARSFQVLVQMRFHDQGTVPGYYKIEDAWFESEEERES